MTTVNVCIPGGDFRLGGIWPVRRALRSIPPAHWQHGFCPVFQRLAEPIDRPTWKRSDYTGPMPLDEAENFPVCGEA